MRKHSKEYIYQIEKLVQLKLSKKLTFIELLKKFIKLPTKEEAKKIVDDSSEEDLDRALKYLPKLIANSNIKESFNFSSIKKHILLLASIAVLGLGTPEAKAYDQQVLVVHENGSAGAGRAIGMGIRGIFNTIKNVKQGLTAKGKAKERLSRILSHLGSDEKKLVKYYLEKEKYDLEMITLEDINKEFEGNEKKSSILKYFEKVYVVRSMFHKEMDTLEYNVSMFESLLEDSLDNVQETQKEKDDKEIKRMERL